MDDIGDSLDAVAAGIAHWLFDGWGHLYPACYRQRFSTDPSRSGNKDDERHCSDLGPLTCSGRRAVPMKPIRLMGTDLIVPGIDLRVPGELNAG